MSVCLLLIFNDWILRYSGLQCYTQCKTTVQHYTYYIGYHLLASYKVTWALSTKSIIRRPLLLVSCLGRQPDYLFPPPVVITPYAVTSNWAKGLISRLFCFHFSCSFWESDRFLVMTYCDWAEAMQATFFSHGSNPFDEQGVNIPILLLPRHDRL